MKAHLVPPVPMEPTIQLEITKREAVILRALVGGVRVTESEAGTFIRDMFRTLSDAGLASKESFSDFFKGDAQCK